MQSFAQNLSLELVEVKHNIIEFVYHIDAKPFHSRWIYDQSFSFESLEKNIGIDVLKTALNLMAWINALQFMNVYPISSTGEGGDSYNQDLEALFKKLFDGIFAQHRYENNIKNYNGVDFSIKAEESHFSRVDLSNTQSPILLSCGGGKDSLLCMKLLEEASIPYSTVQYAHSDYGNTEHQHHLIDALLDKCSAVKQHRITIENQLNLEHLRGVSNQKITTYTSPETPIGLFACLPIVLEHQYRELVVGHERDSDTEGSFFWEEMDTDVNHQYGKSLDAELAMSNFIEEHLIKGFRFFSLLRPIHDYKIFQRLAPYKALLSSTHSCNVDKPWCQRCAKCLYVWLNFTAYCDVELFDYDPLSDVKCQLIFQGLLGLTKHKPFECIGEIHSSQLAMYRLMQKGYTGDAINLFQKEILPGFNHEEILKKYDRVYANSHNIPTEIFRKCYKIE